MANEIFIQLQATEAPVIFMENAGIDVYAEATEVCEIMISPMGERGLPGQSTTESALVFNEVPMGAINGSNSSFITVFPFVPESLEVFVNGLKQSVVSDYQTIGSNIILLVFSPSQGENIIVNYKKII